MRTPEVFLLAGRAGAVCYWSENRQAVFIGDAAPHEVLSIDVTMADLDLVASALTEQAATRAIRALADRHNERYLDVAYDSLGELAPPMAKAGYDKLFRSRSDRTPLKLSKRALAQGVEAELCSRDLDCAGSHRWVLGHENEFDVLVWHVNLDTGGVVPPTPLVFRS